jgi:adenine-specific DNA-methyltransferase
VIFSFGGNLERPGLEKKTPLSVLIHEKKWTRFPATQQRADSGYVLGDLFSIKRGLATGDNSYFILSAERVRELDLPQRF